MLGVLKNINQHILMRNCFAQKANRQGWGLVFFWRTASVLALVQSHNDSGSIDGTVNYSESHV